MCTYICSYISLLYLITTTFVSYHNLIEVNSNAVNVDHIHHIYFFALLIFMYVFDDNNNYDI